jgi:hypothetical protein
VPFSVCPYPQLLLSLFDFCDPMAALPPLPQLCLSWRSNAQVDLPAAKALLAQAPRLKVGERVGGWVGGWAAGRPARGAAGVVLCELRQSAWIVDNT